jgi:hypothetical protein
MVCDGCDRVLNVKRVFTYTENRGVRFNLETRKILIEFGLAEFIEV